MDGRLGADAVEADDASFRAVCEASPIPFALNDDDGNITYLNPEFVRTFGYTRAEIPTLADWWPRAYPDPGYRAEVAREWATRLADAMRTGSPFEPMEVVIRALDGSRHTVVAYAASLGRAKAGIHLVVLYDVTRERRLAEAQRVLQAQLAHVQRVESVGQLAGGLAHDFNNTLGVVLGRVELALKVLPPEHAIVAHLIEIQQAAQHSAELIRQLLAYARRQQTAPQVIDVNETVEASMRMLRIMVGERVHLRWLPCADLWLVEMDPSQLDQVITNLCVNARDALMGAGEVTLRTKNVTVEAGPFADRSGLVPGDYVALAVADDGPGVDPEIAGRIFEPFFTTKTGQAGEPHHGLGLSIVYGIARQNEGGLVLEPGTGRGATFEVYLPRARNVSSREGPRAV